MTSHPAVISVSWPHVPIRVSRGCRPHELYGKVVSASSPEQNQGCRSPNKRTGPLDIADNASGLVIHELDAHLCDSSSRAFKKSALIPSKTGKPHVGGFSAVLGNGGSDRVPVRPNTLVTFTSLTGTFDESILFGM